MNQEADIQGGGSVQVIKLRLITLSIYLCICLGEQLFLSLSTWKHQSIVVNKTQERVGYFTDMSYGIAIKLYFISLIIAILR